MNIEYEHLFTIGKWVLSSGEIGCPIKTRLCGTQWSRNVHACQYNTFDVRGL